MHKKSSPSIKVTIQNLKRIRIENNLTQEAFAELMGLDYKYYQKVETGKQNELLLSTIDRFSSALGINSWQLINPKIPKVLLKSKNKSPHYSRKKISSVRSTKKK